jgi:hypothetical protein
MQMCTLFWACTLVYFAHAAGDVATMHEASTNGTMPDGHQDEHTQHGDCLNQQHGH